MEDSRSSRLCLASDIEMRVRADVREWNLSRLGEDYFALAKIFCGISGAAMPRQDMS